MRYINGLHFNNIRGDIYGGLTAAVVALPLAMAMGVASGVGPVAGMYSAIFVGLFAALFGGTPAQVSGPTGPMTVVMAAIFIQYTGMFPDDPAQGAALAFTVVIMGGLFQILFGILRIGKYIELVPHPVVSGFMSGIGVIIILLQIGPLLGHAPVSKPLEAAIAIPEFLTTINPSAATLGLLTLLVVYTVPRFLPRLNALLPSPLLALIAGTAAYLLFFADSSAPILGEIPTGLPTFQLPTIEIELLSTMIISALTLAALGTIDSLLTSLVADNITRTQHKSDRELIGQGIGNTVSGLFGGLPGAGATMRTVVNVKAGGRTPLSGALHALVLLAVVLGAGPLASNIPNAVLAGILLRVGTDIIDWNYIKLIGKVPGAGVVIMAVVLVTTVTIDLLLAVGIGMIMASMVFMQRMSDNQLSCIKTVKFNHEELPLDDREKAIMTAADGRILLFHLSGPMSFSAARGMVRRHAAVQDYDIMLLDLSNMTMLDFTSAKAIEDIIVDTRARGRQVFLVGASAAITNMLNKQGVLRHLETDQIYQLRIDALNHASQLLNIPLGDNCQTISDAVAENPKNSYNSRLL